MGSMTRSIRAAVAALALVACSGETLPADPSDAGRRPLDDGGKTTNSGDARVPLCPSCNDAGVDAADAFSSQPESGLPDAARPIPGDRARDAAFDAAPRDAAPGDAATESAAPDAEVLPAGYPAGHYGTELGNTFPFLRWEGYVAEAPDAGLVSDGPFTDYSSDDMRRSGKTLALLHIADFDCPGCNHAATVLAAGAPAAEEAGALLVEVLGSFEFTNPADRAHLDAWIRTYELTMTSVIDSPGHGLTTLTDVGIRETALVIDLTTMQIVFRMTGDLSGIGPSSLDSAFTYLHDHLGH
jgi:hypothetical protein